MEESCTAIAIQQRYVAAKESIELVLEASNEAIPSTIDALRSYEMVMRNFLDLHERSTFSSKGSAEDKHLKDIHTGIFPKIHQIYPGV